VEAQLEDHVIVVGYGRVGHAVVRSLTRMERPCVVLDRNPDLQGTIEASGAIHVAGDATNEDDLRRAGIERAAAFVAAADQDSANLVVVLTARAVSPALRIVSRVNESTWLTRMKRAGADVAQSPYDSYGDSLAASALSPAALNLRDLHMLGLGLGLGTEEIILAEDSPLVGGGLARLRDNYPAVHILGLRRNEKLHRWHEVPEPLESADVLVALGTPDNLADLARAGGLVS
jgi:voltage-gated potassium channel